MSDEIEVANTVEAYTFLARHLLTTFPNPILDWRARRILGHAIEHITGEKSPNWFERFWRVIK